MNSFSKNSNRFHQSFVSYFLHITFTDALSHAREFGNITIVFVAVTSIYDDNAHPSP